MSVSGQIEKSGCATGKSALPSIADIVRQAREVRKVPTGDLAAKIYSDVNQFTYGEAARPQYENAVHCSSPFGRSRS
jgi:hypothetical protein